MGEEHTFPITRGVRQTDLLSPLFFNALLEFVIQDWLCGVGDKGIALTAEDAQERLTNVRYADDLLLFSRSRAGAVTLLNQFVIFLRKCGLEINQQKTKVLPPCPIEHASDVLAFLHFSEGPVIDYDIVY